MGRALLLFPLRPFEAAAALRGRRAPWLAPLPLALIACAYLLARGCAAADAALGGLSLLALVVGLGLGGAAGIYPASFVSRAGNPVAGRVGSCLVFASWTVLLFLLLLGMAKMLGVGSEAVLVVALILLAWGTAAGIAVVGGPPELEAGRALVASCIGLAGSLAGLGLALLLVESQFLVLAPAPAAGDGFQRGAPLLVRRGSQAHPGDTLLMRARGSREGVLARCDAGGRIQPLGAVDLQFWSSRKWDTHGRVFFRFGGSWAGSAVLRGPSR